MRKHLRNNWSKSLRSGSRWRSANCENDVVIERGELYMEEVKEKLVELRESVGLTGEELSRSDWDKLYSALEPMFDSDRKKWFEEFVELIGIRIGDDEKTRLPDFIGLPARQLKVLKAFQVFGCVLGLASSKLIEMEDINAFVWGFMKKISYGEEHSCRGFYSRYFDNDYVNANFLYDITKEISSKEVQASIETDEVLISKVEEFKFRSMVLSTCLVGAEEEFIRQAFGEIEAQS